ncbi:MAG: UDP-N-acetylglucosamine--N-acetylmuramyl-(pentapeptide) pyrophosphoryl-undecaprenol N-acetylglucosamine transferase, partial [Opitutae bacterium]|nr:UDP-N-acetylglucosamine--N-acetylmuramyl-(pentapeptide) pyrophosphoryl-undecaprenol N-acetylglucosamine transferase [Opitutae bacterium]
RFVSFTDEMNAVLSAADLVITRAGAGAIAEIVRCRIPSIMIPYPHAADNHQFLNAEFLERKGGGILCSENNIMDSLMDEVREVMFNEEFRTILRRNLFAMDNGDEASRISDDLCLCLKQSAIQQTTHGGVLRMIG